MATPSLPRRASFVRAPRVQLPRGRRHDRRDLRPQEHRPGRRRRHERERGPPAPPRPRLRRAQGLDGGRRARLTGQLLGRPTWRDKHSEYLLPGFLSCAVCQGSGRTVTLKYGCRPRRYPVRFYGCAEHENRGPAVCANDVRLRHEVLDQAVLAALAELLDERLVDAAVDRAVERLRAGQSRHLGRRGEVERELSLLEYRLRRGYDTLLDGDGALPGLRERLRRGRGRQGGARRLSWRRWRA